MLPQRLTLALILAIVVFFIAVLWLLKNRRLALKYTLLWFLTAFLMLLLVLFPGLMNFAASLVGIQSRMNALYIFLIAFLILLVFSLTSIVSRQTDRIRSLAQAQAILEKRVRELEEGTFPADPGGAASQSERTDGDDGKTDPADTEAGVSA